MHPGSTCTRLQTQGLEVVGASGDVVAVRVELVLVAREVAEKDEGSHAHGDDGRQRGRVVLLLLLLLLLWSW